MGGEGRSRGIWAGGIGFGEGWDEMGNSGMMAEICKRAVCGDTVLLFNMLYYLARSKIVVWVSL